jgi:hypothetical protein
MIASEHLKVMSVPSQNLLRKPAAVPNAGEMFRRLVTGVIIAEVAIVDCIKEDGIEVEQAASEQFQSWK